MYIKPIEALQNEETIASIVLEAPIHITTAPSAVFEKIDGSGSTALAYGYQVQSTTVASVDSSDPSTVTVADASTFLAGESIYHLPAVSSSSETPVPTVLYIYTSNQSSDVITFESPPATPFQVGDKIDSLTVTMTIPAALTETLGTDYRVR